MKIPIQLITGMCNYNTILQHSSFTNAGAIYVCMKKKNHNCSEEAEKTKYNKQEVTCQATYREQDEINKMQC